MVWEAHLGCRTEHVLEKPAANKSEMVVTWTTVTQQWDKADVAEAFWKH